MERSVFGPHEQPHQPICLMTSPHVKDQTYFPYCTSMDMSACVDWESGVIHTKWPLNCQSLDVPVVIYVIVLTECAQALVWIMTVKLNGRN